MTSYPPPPGEQPAPGQYPTPAVGQQPQPGAYPPPAQPQPGAYPPPGQPVQPGAAVPPNPYVPGSGTPAEHVDVKAGQIGWLVPLGALLAVVGLFTPWFKPSIKATRPGNGGRVSLPFENLYSIKDGRIGILAPVVLVVVAVGVVSLLQGRVPRRFAGKSRHPVSSAGLSAIGAGVLSLLFLVVAWFLLPGQLTVSKSDAGEKLSGYNKIKDRLEGLGYKDLVLSHGAKIGFWLTAIGALLVIVAGVLLFLDGKKQQAAQAGKIG